MVCSAESKSRELSDPLLSAIADLRNQVNRLIDEQVSAVTTFQSRNVDREPSTALPAPIAQRLTSGAVPMAKPEASPIRPIEPVPAAPPAPATDDSKDRLDALAKRLDGRLKRNGGPIGESRKDAKP